MKNKNSGFTLIELLAVIIILGVLMIVAIPSVTEYISSSRKNAYITTAGQYISGARNKINAAEIPMYDIEATYYLPTSCISLEKGGDSPFGEIEEGYIVVTYDGYGYDYYFTVRDSSNQGILLTDDELLNIERVKNGIKDINELIAIEGKEKILMVENCGDSFLEYVAVDTIPVNGKLESNVEIQPQPPIETPEENLDTTPLTFTVSVTGDYYAASEATITLTNAQTKDYPIKIDYYIKLASAADSTYIKEYTTTLSEGTIHKYNYTTIQSYESYMLKIVVTDASGNESYKTQTAGVQCFLSGTKVLTETGLKNIEDIKVGELVYSINTDTNARELKRITALYTGSTTEVYEITVGNEVIKTTPKHQFYVVDKGWIRAYELEVGDELVSTSEENIVIKGIAHKTNQEPVAIYNLTVEGNHNYLVTKYRLLVHNASSSTES